MSAEMTVEGMISVFMKIRKVYADEFGRMLGVPCFWGLSSLRYRFTVIFPDTRI